MATQLIDGGEYQDGNLLIRISYLVGTMEFVPPKYWLERDGNGWKIASDYIGISGFETEREAILAAKAAGMVLGSRV